MKKLILASVMAMTGFGLVYTPALRAQDSDTIQIKDPAEFNAYQNASSQSDLQAKAAALEGFLQAYPQSVVKKTVLDMLIDTYQGLNNPDKTVSAAGRLLEIDQNNMKAIFISVYVKKSQGAKNNDVQALDDAAALATRGLSAPKPASMSEDDWKKLTSGAYPVFHSALAADYIVSKKDVKSAIKEYRTELMLYTPEQTTKGAGLWDTLQLAEAYTKPDGKDLIQAVWFYARAWNFATPLKAQINGKLEFYYKRYHGDLNGLDDIKAQAAQTVFPAGTFTISAAATPAEIAHKALIETPDLSKLALGDSEFILAVGTKEDADKVWAVLKDKTSPAPGIVIEAPVALKVVADGAKKSEAIVALEKQADLPTSTDAKELAAFLNANGVKEDVAKLALGDDTKKITIEPVVAVIKVAVSDDAKAAKTADFIVKLKTPISVKEAPAAGFVYGIPPATTLVGVYDTYSQVAATPNTVQSAQIILRDGEIIAAQKAPAKAAAPAHKPAAAHKAH